VVGREKTLKRIEQASGYVAALAAK
jgi:hypothetical protein